MPRLYVRSIESQAKLDSSGWAKKPINSEIAKSPNHKITKSFRYPIGRYRPCSFRHESLLIPTSLPLASAVILLLYSADHL
jgi:hypothetical protein